MADHGDPRDSEIEIRHLHRVARIPFYLSPKSAWLIVIGLILIDLMFAGAYLFSTLPEVRALTVNHRLAILDLDLEANLPTGYSAVKLFAGGILCLLMIYSFEHGSPRPRFWYIAAGVLLFLALDEIAQLHEVWAAGIAVKLFGGSYSGNRYTLISHGIVLGAFYLSSLTQFPGRSRIAFGLLIASGAVLILSQAPREWHILSLRPVFEYAMAVIIERFGDIPAKIAWEETLELIGFSLVVGALAVGISEIQRSTVRYIYHPPAT